MAREIPTDLKYGGAERWAVSAKPKVVTMFPESDTTYVPGDTDVIRIPIKGDHILFDESYLQFTFTNTTADGTAGANRAVSPDYSYYSLFKTMRIYSSAGVIDHIENYGLYVNKMLQYIGRPAMTASAGSFMGMPPDSFLGSPRTAALGAIAALATFTVHLPLMGGLFSSMHGKPFPAHLLSGGLVLELTLDSAANCLVGPDATDATPAYSVSNVRALLSDLKGIPSAIKEAERMKLMSEAKMEFAGESVRQIATTLSAGTTEKNIALSPDISSAKTVLCIARDSASIGVKDRPGLSCSSGENFSVAALKSGDDIYPTHRIKSKQHAFFELQKGMGKSLSDLESLDCAVRWSNWNDTTADISADSATAGICMLQTFALGWDLQAFEEDDTKRSGLKLEADSTIELEYSGDLTSTGARRFDIYIIHDRTYIITPDGTLVERH